VLDTSLPHQAKRIDPATGVREIAEFFGPEEPRTFGFTHLPSSRPVGGVVICSPLYAEFNRNYRREVLIARQLASLGVAVQRFHYRGHGNSQGGIHDATFDTMLDDALAAAQRLVDSAGVNNLAFFGTRFGGLVAASAATRFGKAPLVLWDPVLNHSQYLRDIYRAYRIQALKEGARSSESAEGMEEHLRRDGELDILGYTITRSLYEGVQDRSLDKEVGLSPRPLLVIRFGRDPRLERGISELVLRWQMAGFDVNHLSIGRQEAWWFTSGALVIQEALTEPVDLTVDWLMKTFDQRTELL